MAGSLPTPPSEDGIHDIYQMTFSRDPKRRTGNHFMFHDVHDGPMPIDYNVWILHNAQRTILVDTGFGPRAAQSRDRPLTFDPVDGLRRIGIDPDAVEDVIISHLHYDHAGSLDRFPKARFHIQDDEVSYATGRCMCDPLLRWPFEVEDITTLIRRLYAGRVAFYDGDSESDGLPGVRFYGLGGHSARVMGTMVETRRGPVLLASDATHFYANALNMKPFSFTMDLAETLVSYRRILKLAGGAPDRFVPGHDPKVRLVFPSIEVNGVELVAIHAEPKAYDPAELARPVNETP